MQRTVSRILRISPYVTDAIFGYLCSDTESITACSLTCSAWTPPAQAHLFHDLRIPSLARAKSFLSLLASSPHLALYPRVLEITTQADEDHMETAIPLIAPQLSEVRKLRYCGVQFSQLSPRTIVTLQSSFPQVRNLAFERCRFNSCDDLVALVLASTRVETLWLNEAEWVHSVEESSVNPELWGVPDTRLPLSCVTMRHVDRGLVECLLSPEMRTRLDCMVLSPVYGRQRMEEFSGRGINLLCDTLRDVEGKCLRNSFCFIIFNQYSFYGRHCITYTSSTRAFNPFATYQTGPYCRTTQQRFRYMGMRCSCPSRLPSFLGSSF